VVVVDLHEELKKGSRTLEMPSLSLEAWPSLNEPAPA
jgi:hypothetical protein